jgi:hypothetical protein
MSQARFLTPEPTPVDDVRRIRERFSREAGGDIAQHAQQTEAFFELHKDELKKLKVRIVTHRPSSPAQQERKISS